MTTLLHGKTLEHTNDSENLGGGFLIGLLVFIVFVAAILYFGIPVFNRMQRLEVNAPAAQIRADSPQVVVPTVEVIPAN